MAQPTVAQTNYRYIFSSIGRKQLMGATGLLWSFFVMGHMAGNMLIFVGPDAYNKYGHALISNPAIYAIEAVLVLTLLGHIVNGVWLTIQNRGARPNKYAMATSGPKAARFQSKFMAFHGVLLAVFIVVHLISFKFGTHYDTTVEGVVMRDLHRLVVERFQDPLYLGFYVIALAGVGLHLSHGFYSAFASLGIFHTKFSPILSKIGVVYGVVVALGFISQPLYVFFVHR